MKYVTFRNGVQMPRIGFGSWQLHGSICEQAIIDALDSGYELIDTASAYHNEIEIGNLLKKFEGRGHSQLKTSNNKGIFLTSKAAPKEMGAQETYSACLKTLDNLQIDQIDLYLLHWPGAGGHAPNSPKNRIIRLEAWKAMERLLKDNKTRSIGVCNFLPNHLEQLMKDGAEIMPHLNQIEIHPLCPNNELREFAKKEKIILQAYSSLGNGDILKNERIISIAKKEEKTTSQVLLKWALQNDLCIIPKSTKKIHIEENLRILTMPELSQSTINYLDSFSDDKNAQHTCWDPRTIV